MGGFIGWEAFFYILLEIHLKWTVNTTGKYPFNSDFLTTNKKQSYKVHLNVCLFAAEKKAQ